MRSAIALLFFAIMLAPAGAAEMIMLEQPGCSWCARFNAEIAPAYPKTAQGKAAPLRRVDITRPWPDDLGNIAGDRYTPTFILVHKGKEISRMRGYPGDHFFWHVLDQMLAKLHAPAGS